MDMETMENHADGTAKLKMKKKKRKRQKKQCNALESNYMDDKLLENGSLSCADQSEIQHSNNEPLNSYSEAAEMDSTRMKKNHDLHTGNSLILEETSSFSKSADGNSMKKKDELDEVNMLLLEAKSIKTYQRKKSVKTYERKKKKLLDSSRSSLELSKDNGYSTSIQAVQNNLMEGTPVKCSDDTHTSERNKAKKLLYLESGGTIEHVCVSSLDFVDKEDNSLESCKDGRSTSSPTGEDIPIGESSANCDKRPTSKKRNRKKKVKPITYGDEASEDTSSRDPSAKQLELRNGEIENALERSVEGCHVFAEEKLEVSPTECKMEGKIPSLSNVDVRKDAITLVVINKEVEASHSSPERALISCSRRKLLILDLNGLLADIVSFVPDGYEADMKFAKKALFKRPFCDDFLKFCFERFDVGVWSSRTKRNVDIVVDFLMGDMKNKLLFCWDQYHCTETGYNTVEDRHKPLILKELKKLWEKHEPNLPWEKGYYNESNTLLLDDSPYKALRNPPHTAVFPYSYRFWDTNDNSLGPGGDLRVYLEGLVMAEDIQKYVEQHPFGQRAITKANTSWVFYLKVIGTNVST
ncbi:hypothetical protein HHK36_015478 [Tetracentron sinense]|uniref:Mitochondrial import inner membrane translocase subunit TIM50 n=1 Tax=Tetracentron sinense TaxID=13715 RepID=A0A834Z0Z8_TETSI|nr:hypothetical protein HHK36_015478 [Tetracentron sinense]